VKSSNNNLKKSKKFEEKRNKSKEKNKNINPKKTENMENIMKELNDNLEKDNDIHLSGIDNSNSHNNLKKISSQLMNDDQILFNYHSDNDIILDSNSLLI
jgi:hypothetical protein